MSQEQPAQQIAIGKNIVQAWGEGASASVTVYEFVPPAPVDTVTLVAARARLAQLPLDTLPGRASLPEGSRMPFSRNPLFVGREDDLKRLAKVLKTGETTAIGQIAAATGLGGIGKTQLASEFVHRYGQYFAGGTFWLSLANPDNVPAEVAQCGGRGHLNLAPDFEQLDLPTQVQMVLSAWQSPLPRLLVFDNCEDETLLVRWRPPAGDCRVLVTSRRGEWDVGLGVQALQLGVLSRKESVALLQKFRPDLAEDDARTIAAELGDLPLALHLAGSFLKRYQQVVTPGAYLAQLRDQALLDHDSLQGRGAGFSPTGHEQHVARTFALSYDRLNPNDLTDRLALRLLVHAAYFAAGEPLPRELLLKTLDLNKDDSEALMLAEDALIRLVEHGLLEIEVKGALVLHRLLAVFVQKKMIDKVEVAQEAVERTILAELSGRVDQGGYLGQLLTLRPHLQVVTEAAQKRTDERAANLCSWLGYYLSQIGDLARAHPYLERMLEIIEQLQEIESLDTAYALNSLGSLLVSQGDYMRARSYLERALEIVERMIGSEHPDTANVLNNLGYLSHAEGEHSEARFYFERALEIRQKTLGEEHPDTALILSNLGALLNSQQKYTEAQSYLEQALKIRQKVLGENHPDVAHDLNSLGYLFHLQGNLSGAQPYYEQALKIRQEVLGEDHPDRALSLNNLGYLLKDMGNLADAQTHYEQALYILEVRLGPDHPYTQMVRSNLAALDKETSE